MSSRPAWHLSLPGPQLLPVILVIISGNHICQSFPLSFLERCFRILINRNLLIAFKSASMQHPQIQKESQYIKYLCCDDARTLRQWVMGIRIAKVRVHSVSRDRGQPTSLLPGASICHSRVQMLSHLFACVPLGGGITHLLLYRIAWTNTHLSSGLRIRVDFQADFSDSQKELQTQRAIKKLKVVYLHGRALAQPG